MKRLLLIIIGLSLFGFDGAAQRGKGNSRSHHERGKADKHEAPRGNAYGHHKNKDYKKNHHNRKGSHSDHHSVNRRVTVYSSHNGHHGHERVVHRYRPGIRYVRTVTIAPRAYVSISINHRHVRRRVLLPEEIDLIAYDMSREYYDDVKLDIAKSAIRNEMVYSEDVAFLIDQLDFEDNRLELAKFAYARTVDKRNYDLVYNNLNFHASRRNLDRYIHRW